MNNEHTTPKRLDSKTLDFARSLNTNSQIIYVQVKPFDRALANECFSNVSKMVEQHGGERILGWQIWEWPGVFAEAEAHAIWQSPDYELYDVTPKVEQRIAFITDPTLNFTGVRINNIRHAISDCEIVKDFIAAGDFKHKIFGSIANGVRLEQWQVVIGGRLDFATGLLPKMFKGGGKANPQCPCGSKLTYRDCHRTEIKRTIEMAEKLTS